MPKGSKLAPLLYILYANNIAKIFIFAKVKMYADDFTIFAVVKIMKIKINFKMSVMN